MSEIKTEAVKRAVNWLIASNCKFHVVMEDGTTFGEPIVTVAKRSSWTKKNDFASMGYIRDMLNMKPGDEKTWELGTLASAFKKTLSGQAIRMWGSGSYVIQSNDAGSVTILRME